MPSYANNPFQGAVLAQKGVPCYLFGSYNNKQSPTQARISNVALTSNVATVTVQIYGGEIPTAGSLISIAQTASTSGLFNVNRVALTSATIDGNGTGTFIFPLTHADVVSAADTGTAIVDVPEVAETLAAGASIAACLQGGCDGQFTLPMAVGFTAIPTAVTVTLQKSIRNVDAEFTDTTTKVTVAASAFTAGPVVEATLERGYFYRANVSGLTAGGGSGLIVKIGG